MTQVSHLEKQRRSAASAAPCCRPSPRAPESTVTVHSSSLKGFNSFSMFIWFYKAPDTGQIPLVL